jgi:hypothetical protein
MSVTTLQGLATRTGADMFNDVAALADLPGVDTGGADDAVSMCFAFKSDPVGQE